MHSIRWEKYVQVPQSVRLKHAGAPPTFLPIALQFSSLEFLLLSHLCEGSPSRVKLYILS